MVQLRNVCLRFFPQFTLKQRRQVILIGRVASLPVVVGFNAAENPMSNHISREMGAMTAVNQFFFQGGEETLHARIVKTAMCTPHALADRTISSNKCAVFMACVLTAVVGMQNQPLLIPVPTNSIAQSVTTQTGVHICIH